MNRIEQLESLFHQALTVPAAELPLWLDAHCPADGELRAELAEMLEARIAMQASGAALAAREEAPIPTGSFGAYRAVSLLGRGGTSAVYLAERADGQFTQTVALKILAAHLAGAGFLRRFEVERQLLASLNHHHITRLLDGGVSAAGEPFLITEYVDGEPLDRYCDRLKLPLEERLRIFLQVCDAVEHAHRNLIVHRDLKPANILVNTEGAVKLLDFGTAALLAADSRVTVTRLRMLTPRYASPEQLRGERLNIATDIFSLGIVFYELLTGAWPFGDPESVIGELQRATQGTGPAQPSTVVTEESATARALPHRQLRRILKGDLSSIAFKALEHDPAQRYAGVRQFAADIENFLAARPVLARPQTGLYRAGKFIRRRWATVLAATVFTLGLSAATLIARQEARIAQERYSQMRSLTTTLLFDLKDAINDVPGSTAAQQILVTRVVKSLDSLSGQSARDPKLRLDLAEAYRQLGELQGSPYGQNLGDTTGALVNLAKARSLLHAPLQLRPNDVPTLHAATLVERTTGEVYFGTSQTREAVAHVTAATEFAEAALRFSNAFPDRIEAAVAHQVLGDLYGQPGTGSLGQPEPAAVHYRRTIELDQAMVRQDPQLWRAVRGIAITRMKLGDLSRVTDPEAALAEFRQALEIMDSLPPVERDRPANSRLRAQFVRKVGSALVDLQQWREALQTLNPGLAVFEQAFAADPGDARAQYDLFIMLQNFEDIYERSGEIAQALPVAHRIVAILEAMLRKQPNNREWAAGRAYYQFRLATILARSGAAGQAGTLGAAALNALRGFADAPDATTQILGFGAEAESRIEPAILRDTARAMRYARRDAALRPPNDPTPLAALALAQHAAGLPEAAATARQALALLAPPRNGHIPFLRAKLEAIH